MELRLVSEPNAAADDIELVKQGLYRFNMRVVNAWDYVDIVIFLRDADGSIQGGILGTVWCGWFHLDFLWIADGYRDQGYGDQLMQAAEAEVRAAGAKHAYLETFSFQARPFYERHGYHVVGELPDYPPGQTYYYLAKTFGD